VSDRLTIAVCDHHHRELTEVLGAEQYADVDLVQFPSRCGTPPLRDAELEEMLGPHPRGDLQIFGGSCMQRSRDDLGLGTGSKVCAPQHCLEHLVDRSLVKTWVTDGTYLVSAGWLGAWRDHIADLGFDEATARLFFAESATNVLLLDTGFHPTAEVDLREFAAFLDLPWDRIEVGLDHLAERVSSTVLAWRLARQRTGEGAPPVTAEQEPSLYALAFEQLRDLSDRDSEDAVVGRILDLFTMLCAPAVVAWLPGAGATHAVLCRPLAAGHDGSLAAFLRGQVKAVRWTDDGHGFSIRIGAAEDPLGTLFLGDFAQAGRAKEYLNLALALRGVCELALSNARAWIELRKAEGELAARADAFQILATNADGLVVVDESGTVRFANPAARRLLDVHIGASFEVDLESRGDASVTDARGRERLIETRIVRSEWEGQPAALASLRDVTEQRQAEEALRSSERMTLLGELAGRVAHDFNNVLQAVSGSLELALRPDGDPTEQVERIREALYSADRGSELARRLLLFSRPGPRETKVVDLGAEVVQMQPLLRQVAGDGVAVVVLATPSGLHVETDLGDVEQILLNLVANGRDAVERQGRLEIEVAAVDGRARLSVEDFGMGIAPELLERIFEPFFTTKGPGAGTGLGLASVRAAVDRIGGELSVRSEVGRGTRFDVLLPITATGTDVLPEAPPPFATAAETPRRVLVVDDEAMICSIMRSALEAAGHTVVTAPDGLAALELLQNERGPDALMTDVSMPGLDGFELARRARELHPGVRVILMSGLADFAIEQLGLDPKGVAMLSKPFRLGEALRCLDSVFEP